MINALLFFQEKKHTTNGSKKDKLGNIQDEIVPYEKFAVWFYHANPIALYWYETGEIIKANCGWETKTTKARLNSLPGPYIRTWAEFRDNSDEIYRLIKEAQGATTDENLTAFTVAFCPDNGDWSDAPFPHAQVQKEVDAVRAYLTAHHFRHHVAYVQTGNFCVRHDICVNGNTFREALALLKEMPKTGLHYVMFQEAV